MEECKESIPLVELLGAWILRDIKIEDGEMKDHYINTIR